MPNNDISVANHARIYFVVCSMRSKAITVTAICAMVVFVAQTGSAQSKRKSAAEWKKTVYVSAATGEVLFTSDDNNDSHTCWPSFVKPVDPSMIAVVEDKSYGMV